MYIIYILHYIIIYNILYYVNLKGVKVGLSREDALCRSMSIVGVNLIASRVSCVWPP